MFWYNPVRMRQIEPPTRPGGLDIQAWNTLTIAERRVVKYTLQGLHNREIGKLLHISENTVKTHLSRAFKKLQLHSRLDLINRSSDSDLHQP